MGTQLPFSLLQVFDKTSCDSIAYEAAAARAFTTLFLTLLAVGGFLFYLIAFALQTTLGAIRHVQRAINRLLAILVVAV